VPETSPIERGRPLHVLPYMHLLNGCRAERTIGLHSRPADTVMARGDSYAISNPPHVYQGSQIFLVILCPLKQNLPAHLQASLPCSPLVGLALVGLALVGLALVRLTCSSSILPTVRCITFRGGGLEFCVTRPRSAWLESDYWTRTVHLVPPSSDQSLDLLQIPTRQVFYSLSATAVLATTQRRPL
jgi:hypothetical protein